MLCAYFKVRRREWIAGSEYFRTVTTMTSQEIYSDKWGPYFSSLFPLVSDSSFLLTALHFTAVFPAMLTNPALVILSTDAFHCSLHDKVTPDCRLRRNFGFWKKHRSKYMSWIVEKLLMSLLGLEKQVWFYENSYRSIHLHKSVDVNSTIWHRSEWVRTKMSSRLLRQEVGGGELLAFSLFVKHNFVRNTWPFFGKNILAFTSQCFIPFTPST